jgi:uncharacterized integral membrane protein
MTEPAGPHATSSTLLPPQPTAPATSRPHPARARGGETQLRARISGMRTAFTAGIAALTVIVIFIIQNVHAANISFLGVHLVLPLAGALLLAAIAGSLLTVAGGPARISQLRQATGRGMRTARGGMTAPTTASFLVPADAPTRARKKQRVLPLITGQTTPDNKQPARVTD